MKAHNQANVSPALSSKSTNVELYSHVVRQEEYEVPQTLIVDIIDIDNPEIVRKNSS